MEERMADTVGLRIIRQTVTTRNFRPPLILVGESQSAYPHRIQVKASGPPRLTQVHPPTPDQQVIVVIRDNGYPSRRRRGSPFQIALAVRTPGREIADGPRPCGR